MSPLRHYFRTLWIAICGDEGFVYVRNTYLEGLEARIATFEAKAKRDFETRSLAQKNRTKPAATSTNGATQ